MRLDHFLQRAGMAQSGGHAKLLIQGGDVCVNGDVETRRRRKLIDGDVVHVAGREQTFVDPASGSAPSPTVTDESTS